MRPLQFHRQIDSQTWLLGGSLLIRWTDTEQLDDCLAQWPDGKGYLSLQRYDQHPIQTVDTIAEEDTEHSIFNLIHDAGDASAVWAVGADTICKIKELTANVCREGDIIAFVQKHLPSIPVPEALFSYDEHPDCTVLFLRRVPGVTLRDAWTTLTQQQQNQICSQVADYCEEMASLTSEMLCGVGGACVLEPYLSMTQGAPLQQLTVSEAQSIFTDYSPSGTEAPQIKEFHFYHADLGPSNIIVAGGAIQAIIDWESAGFYPRFWIATKPSVSPGLDFDPMIEGVEEHHWRKLLKERLAGRGYEPRGDWWMGWRRNVKGR